jgi:ABC-type transport system involved in multi-copper enzyme maturation permease subunit
MSAGMVITVYAIARYLPPHLLEGVGLMALEGLFFLTLTILGGTRLSPLGNGVVVFMLYGMAFVAGWMEQFGALTRSEVAVNIGIVASLLVPGEAMWRRAAYLMQPAVMRELSVSPFTAASAPSPAMVLYAALYIVVALGAAIYAFGRRDL